MTDTVQFESEPAGAEAKTSTGHTCRTPCSLALSADAPFSVTFTLNGYLPETEQVELVSDGRRNLQAAAQSGDGRIGRRPPAPKKPAAKPGKSPKKAGPQSRHATEPKPKTGGCAGTGDRIGA